MIGFSTGDSAFSAGEECIENAYSLYLASDQYCVYTHTHAHTHSITNYEAVVFVNVLWQAHHHTACKGHIHAFKPFIWAHIFCL